MANKMIATKKISVRERTHEGIDRMMDKAEDMRDGSVEAMGRLKEKAIMMKENVDGYIRKNPGKSVLIAAGVGAAVGAIFAAAMMRRRQ